MISRHFPANMLLREEVFRHRFVGSGIRYGLNRANGGREKLPGLQHRSTEGNMKVAVLGLVGLILGSIVGGVIGIGLGLIWTTAFHTSSFEGYSGMLVFFTFMPIGMILGALSGAVGFGYAASRDRAG
jgi:hypothetical protein